MTNLKQQDHEELTTESKVAEWLKQHGRSIFYGLGALVFVFIAVFYWGERKQSETYRDFLSAEQLMQQLQKEGSSQAMTELESILTRHEELRPKYEGTLAHYFLKEGDIEKAQQLFSSSHKRGESANGLLHHAYSENTLRISCGKFKEALQEAQALQEKMDDLEQPPEALLSFNLLRIAVLHQELQDVEAEKNAWKTFKERSSWFDGGEKLSSDQRVLNEHFSQNSIRLSDYITAREQLLYQ